MAGAIHRWGARPIEGTVEGARMRRVHMRLWTVMITLPGGAGVITVDGRFVENVVPAGTGRCQVVTALGVMHLPFEPWPVAELVNEIKADWGMKLRVDFAVLDKMDEYAARMDAAGRAALAAGQGGEVSGASGERGDEAIA